MASSDEPSAGAGRRARLDPRTRRAQIIDAAYELLESAGVGAMAVDDVADAAGVSRSLVYTYFGDRDTLVAEVYLRVLGHIDDRLPPSLVDGIPASRQAIIDMVTVCLQFAQAHPAAWQLLVTDSVRRHPVVAEAREERIARITDGMRGAEPPLVAEASWGLLEAGVLHWVAQQDLPVDAAAEMLATTLWSGLAEVRAADPPPCPSEGPRLDGESP